LIALGYLIEKNGHTIGTTCRVRERLC
jgi:hypothetical protein